MAENERDAASEESATADRKADVTGAVIIAVALVLAAIFFFTG